MSLTKNNNSLKPVNFKLPIPETAMKTQPKIGAQIVIAELSRMEQKYESRVWLARKGSEHLAMPEVAAHAKKVAEMYEEEFSALLNPHSGDWQHGFHSGMLAAMRYVKDYFEDGPKTAAEFFPDLNT